MKKIIFIPLFLMIAASAFAQKGFQLTVNLGLQPTIVPLNLVVKRVGLANGGYHISLLGEAQWKYEQPIAVGIGAGINYYAGTINNVRIPVFAGVTLYLPESFYSGERRYDPLLKARTGYNFNFITYQQLLSSFLYLGVGAAKKNAYRKADLMVDAGAKIVWYNNSDISRVYPSLSIGWTF